MLLECKRELQYRDCHEDEGRCLRCLRICPRGASLAVVDGRMSTGVGWCCLRLVEEGERVARKSLGSSTMWQ